MMRIKLLLIGAMALWLTACSTFTYYADYDKNIDFSKYKTWNFLPYNDSINVKLNQFDQQKFTYAIAREMGKRGLKQVSKDADLKINLNLMVKEQVGMKAYTDYYGGYYGGYGYYGYGGMGVGMGTTQTTYEPYTYKTGTIVVDVFDEKEKKLIWQGVGSGEIDESKSPKTREDKINEVIYKLFDQYPVERMKD